MDTIYITWENFNRSIKIDEDDYYVLFVSQFILLRVVKRNVDDLIFMLL